MWKDNELFGEFVDAIQQYREEVDARKYESEVENSDLIPFMNNCDDSSAATEQWIFVLPPQF